MFEKFFHNGAVHENFKPTLCDDELINVCNDMICTWTKQEEILKRFIGLRLLSCVEVAGLNAH